VRLGDDHPVALAGTVNVSPESFYAGSVRVDDGALLERALAMVEAGAALIDVGARSTAPYLPTAIDDEEESRRLGRAVRVLASKLPVPVSADTARPRAARVALDEGARIVNDTAGLADPALARLVAEYGAGLIVMASPAADGGRPPDEPLATVRRALRGSLERARAAGIPEERVVIDPGLGFFRGAAVPWDEWDARVLANLADLRDLGRPLCVGVSRKSFIGAATGRTSPTDRLAGSLAATAIAVWNGAALIRTHDVAETLDAVRLAERLRGARAAPALR
jgi:dihydropteroate synthase